MTNTFRNSDLFFTLINVPGPLHANYVKIVKDWFEHSYDAKYRYIEDSDIIKESHKLVDIDQYYPGVSTIGIVSNPWVRMVKGWEISKSYPQKFIDLGIDLSSFENSIRSFKNVDPNRYLQSRWLSYTRQDGTTRNADYILREEHIQEDFKPILDYFESSRVLDVPEIPVIDYRSYFSDELKNDAYEIFKEDFDLLGYEF